MLTSCANSTEYDSKPIYEFPDLPQSVLRAGKVSTLPKGPLTSKETKLLLIKMRSNEVNNANQVNVCVDNHNFLKKLYNSTK